MSTGPWGKALFVLSAAVAASGCAAVAGGLLIGGGIAAGRLSMKASLTQQALVRGSHGEVGLIVGIEAMDLHGPRPPLNAALVLDRSGSMSGEKIRFARAAAKEFIRAMRKGDRVSVVTYSNSAEVVLPSTELSEESQSQALVTIDHIYPSGMTNLSGGLLAGRNQILAHTGGGRVNRILLISDGIANVGISDPGGLSRLAEDLRERDVSLTTVGVGLDFNEDVMMRLADRGGGNYYYIRDAHRMAHAFLREFGSMQGMVAGRPELRLELAPGVQVRSVSGYTFEQRGRELRVRLSDISGGARRKVVISLVAPTSQVGKQPVAAVALEYQRPGGGREALRTDVAALVTEDARVATRSVDTKAMREATEAEAADAMQRAITHYERGDRATATREIDLATRRVREKAKRYHFSDDLISGRLQGAAGALRAAPAPSAAGGNHLRKSVKSQAQEMAR